MCRMIIWPGIFRRKMLPGLTYFANDPGENFKRRKASISENARNAEETVR